MLHERRKANWAAPRGIPTSSRVQVTFTLCWTCWNDWIRRSPNHQVRMPRCLTPPLLLLRCPRRLSTSRQMEGLRRPCQCWTSLSLRFRGQGMSPLTQMTLSGSGARCLLMGPSSSQTGGRPAVAPLGLESWPEGPRSSRPARCAFSGISRILRPGPREDPEGGPPKGTTRRRNAVDLCVAGCNPAASCSCRQRHARQVAQETIGTARVAMPPITSSNSWGLRDRSTGTSVISMPVPTTLRILNAPESA